MVALDPGNSKWRMEQQEADANLGIAFWNERRFTDAAAQFDEALQAIQPLANADARNGDYQSSLAETLAWAADAKMANGQLDSAIALRQQQIGLLTTLLNRGGTAVQYQQILLVGQQALGRLLAMKGQREPALTQLRAAVATAAQLAQVEPSNMLWRQLGFQAQLTLADYALAAGKRDEAMAQTSAACETVGRLLGRDGKVPAWRAGLANCEMAQAKLALAAGANDEATTHAIRALAAAQAVKSNDLAEIRYRIAKAYRLIGDAARATGDAAAARAAWANALSALPRGIAEKPLEMDEHATILQRLGRNREAQPIA
jgi:tetratricopeptide (TPR) repeat protein